MTNNTDKYLARERLIQSLNANQKISPSSHTWDVIVIGGGATGLGIALDATTRGFSTLLLEAKDFAKGTSSRSTKLVHGGVRYLAQGDIALVKEALRERGRLANNAPHLFKKQAFIIPGDKVWTAPYYTLGLWIYHKLAGDLSIGNTRFLSKLNTQKRLPNIKPSKVHAGVCYYDGQFDDARLAISLYRSIVEQGGVAVNYFPVVSLLKDEAGKVNGVECRDALSDTDYQLSAKTVINATGVFANDILAMDEPESKPKIVPSQGIHLVVDKKFMPSDDALMIPKTSDGRVLFAVPWHDKLVLGTTDTLVSQERYEPPPLEEEIDFILKTASEYLTTAPTREDVKSVFVGLRPLAAPDDEDTSTKEVSRSHKVEVSQSGLVNIFGGKWTTYRQMAEDTLDEAIAHDLLPAKPCQTHQLRLQGYVNNGLTDKADHDFSSDPLAVYGSDASLIEALITENEALGKKIHADYPYVYAQIEWAIRYELAQTLEDVLARRIRLLFLDAKIAGEVGPSVADFMATRLQWSEDKLQKERSDFAKLVALYQL